MRYFWYIQSNPSNLSIFLFYYPILLSCLLILMYSILPYSFHMCSILLYSSLLYFILLYSILSNPISPFVFFPSDPYLFYLISSYLIRSFPGLSCLTRSDLSFPILSYIVLSDRISYPIWSYLLVSYPIFSDLIGCSAFFFYLILSEPVWSYLIQYLKLCWIRVEPQWTIFWIFWLFGDWHLTILNQNRIGCEAHQRATLVIR